MKRVHSASNLPEAQLLVDLLADRGIRARILNANASSLAGELPIDAALPQVWVDNADDAPRARELIDAFSRGSSTGTVKCPACGEDNPTSFDLCWSCGAGLESRRPDE
jgi:Putative prokaryotic signal transducing protein